MFVFYLLVYSILDLCISYDIHAYINRNTIYNTIIYLQCTSHINYTYLYVYSSRDEL